MARAMQGDSRFAHAARSIRHRWWLVVLTGVAAAALAAWWCDANPREYRAASTVLVDPVPDDDATFTGIPVLHQAGSPDRAVQTAAGLLDTDRAARLTAARLGPGWSGPRVRDQTDVTPRHGTNLVEVAGRDEDAPQAARLASAYATTALGVRRVALRAQLSSALAGLQARLAALPREDRRGEPARELRDRIDRLQVARDIGDPTLTLVEPAAVPSDRVGAPAWIVVAGTGLAGLLLGGLLALLLAGADARVRDEEELRELYPLPVLARIPRGGSKEALNVRPYHSLVAELSGSSQNTRALLLTAASTGEGTTRAGAALGLALAEAGASVVLVDLDLRRPAVAKTLGIRNAPPVSVHDSLRDLESALITAPQNERLRVLVPEPVGDETSLMGLQPYLPRLVANARGLGHYVILDSPPLGQVGDALWLARAADAVLVVARPGRTSRAGLADLRARLERANRRPLGMLVQGSRRRGAAAIEPRLR
jgi:Mrp family chromosome partitioning ATPase